jgi:glycosyltransferase involved in cell wall biosynthesis
MSIMGGGERVAIHSMLSGQKLGWHITLLSEEFDTRRFEDFFGCDGLFERVKRIAYPEFKPKLYPGFLLYQRLYYYQKQFRKLLNRRSEFDLILGTQDVGYVPTTNVPIIQYCYFPEYFRHLKSATSSPFWKLYYEPARVFYRGRVQLIGKFLAVSDFTRGFIKQVWNRDSITLYPPCPVQLYDYDNTTKENLVVTVGRIVPEKRMHILAQIAKVLPKFQFAIIGSTSSQDTSYFQHLENLAPRNLTIIQSPLRKVKDVLAKAKVYVHCAENEHFGITIIEAMAAGCVPIVHDSGGPREIVTETIGYRWRTVDEAAGQVSNLVHDDYLREKLSKAAQTRARQFSPEVFESSLAKMLTTYLK